MNVYMTKNGFLQCLHRLIVYVLSSTSYHLRLIIYKSKIITLKYDNKKYGTNNIYSKQ